MFPLNVFIVFTTVIFAANALTLACLNARVACFDQWADQKDGCSATRDYNDCMARVKMRQVCPNDTVTVEDAYEASVDCGFIPRRKQHNFPSPQKKLIPRFIDSDGTKMYEFVYNGRATYKEASKYCSEGGGSLFIPRNHYNILSLDAFLRNYVTGNILGDMYYTGPAESGNGEYGLRAWGNDGHKFWIGGNDIEKEGEYRFEDGSTISWDFFAYNQGPHDESIFNIFTRRSDDCMAMDLRTLQGYVRNCNDRRTFVCQYRGTPKY